MMRCACGRTFDDIQDFARHRTETNFSCDKVPVTGFEYIDRGDGTYLIGFKGNIHQNHWHVAHDGTVLRVKEDGHPRFSRTDVTKQIREICPEIGISLPWEN